ncbi:branched-chain amino acid aminotransferase [Cohnella zeiphila]|uniref:Branched-chain-amino-acid aminotransferase n=1 Tax=Cohnella zeiphila TaxID=2761120 RepID=A0A7X0VYP5_9BACL|nr:branched-chain amino acid aminotransferase [Cohnella zeiphila]MBB6733163.1 branched-chain amino acid aminotransferase [Cohnella zeiphila]
MPIRRPEPIAVRRNRRPKPKPETDALGFGRFFTDHMFMMDYEDSRGWHDPRIVPYGPIELDPAAKVLHYGQMTFEGMKAYRSPSGGIRLFRPDMNLKRLSRSNVRLGIPPIDEELVSEAIRRLVLLDRDWLPAAPGTSLYIRPFILAVEPLLGVSPSREYRLIMIMTPVGSYYEKGGDPVSIRIETEYVRAVRGGLGGAKTAGNYAASLKAQEEAASRGFAQVLWLDGVHRKYIEEVGSMNVFFRIGEKVVTPALSGSILDGVTRDSVLRLLNHWGIGTEERRIAIDEVAAACRNGTMAEAFGTGTAAVVSPIGELDWDGERLLVGNPGEAGPLTRRLYDELTGIQTGRAPDPFGWTVALDGSEEPAKPGRD